MPEMISLEEARALVLSHAAPLPVETVPVLDAVGRVAAADLKSDIDISPFAHSAMDGFAVRAAELVEASQEAPVELDVVAEIAAGSQRAARGKAFVPEKLFSFSGPDLSEQSSEYPLYKYILLLPDSFFPFLPAC